MFAYRVMGKVVSTDNNAIGGAEVYFVDNGLDEVRSKNEKLRRVLIGSSNLSGAIDIYKEYIWGYSRFIFSKERRKDIAVLVKKPHYKNVERRFNVRSLYVDNGVALIDIGVIGMELQ